MTTWTESRLRAYRRWQIGLTIAWAVSIMAAAGLFLVILPLVRAWLPLPDEVTWITALGVGAELGVLLWVSLRVTREKRRLEHQLRQEQADSTSERDS